MKRIPQALEPLLDQGIIDEVLRPLMMGKEAQVFMVAVGDDDRAAKVYKEAEHRNFKHRAEYTEGRRVRNSRDRRAMKKGSRYGRQQAEANWRSVEVDHIETLYAAGVRVPVPYGCFEGVFLMELVVDDLDQPAPRLADVALDDEDAETAFTFLLTQIARMLEVGIVHGDLSPFNILVDAEGPVLIDFPQAVDAARNPHARALFIRDVRNVTSYFHPDQPRDALRYGEEIWDHYAAGTLVPEFAWTGQWEPPPGDIDAETLLADIQYFERLEAQRQGLPVRPELREDEQEYKAEPPPKIGRGGSWRRK